MGVYIKGMEMPKRGSIEIQIYADGRVTVNPIYAYKRIVGRAVHVPLHGRCVDADKLMREMRLFIKENMLSRDDARELLETIADAPTVLESEEET